MNGKHYSRLNRSLFFFEQRLDRFIIKAARQKIEEHLTQMVPHVHVDVHQVMKEQLK